MKNKILLLVICLVSLNTYKSKSQNFNCGDNVTDSRDGKVYKTIQIGKQCWMKENLNVGIFTISNSTGSAHSDVSDNGIIEKYCYNNIENNCTQIGGLYDWNEMMIYTNTESAQGICPTGWHIPSDSEWYTLENFEDTTINNPTSVGLRGLDAGTKLKQGGIGFDVLLAGLRATPGHFANLNDYGYFWTSSNGTGSSGISRIFIYSQSGITRYADGTDKSNGYSIRCLADDVTININENKKIKNTINIYPNPASKFINIYMDKVKLKKLNVKIYNVFGSMVYSVHLNNSNQEAKIDISKLNDGLYILKLRNEEGFLSRKIIIKH